MGEKQEGKRVEKVEQRGVGEKQGGRCGRSREGGGREVWEEQGGRCGRSREGGVGEKRGGKRVEKVEQEEKRE